MTASGLKDRLLTAAAGARALLPARSRKVLEQLTGLLLMRQATEALEVEDFRAAEVIFMRAAALPLPRLTRLMAYHGAAVALLRLGDHEAVRARVADAHTLLSAMGPTSRRSSEVQEAERALAEMLRLADWGVEHPTAAAELEERDRRERWAARQAPEEPEALPLGEASRWPAALQKAYRLGVQGLMAAGLVAAAAEHRRSAERLLVAALSAARWDRRVERDVSWHLAQVHDQLGRSDEAARLRQRYERLDAQVRSTLRRLRWTN